MAPSSSVASPRLPSVPTATRTLARVRTGTSTHRKSDGGRRNLVERPGPSGGRVPLAPEQGEPRPAGPGHRQAVGIVQLPGELLEPTGRPLGIVRLPQELPGEGQPGQGIDDGPALQHVPQLRSLGEVLGGRGQVMGVQAGARPQVPGPAAGVAEAVPPRHVLQLPRVHPRPGQVAAQQVDQDQPSDQARQEHGAARIGAPNPVAQLLDRLLLLTGHAASQAEVEGGLSRDQLLPLGEPFQRLLEVAPGSPRPPPPSRRGSPGSSAPLQTIPAPSSLRRGAAPPAPAADAIRSSRNWKKLAHASAEQETRALRLDLCGQAGEPRVDHVPPVRVELGVPVSLDQLGGPHDVPRRQGVLDRLPDEAPGLEPLAGPGMQRRDLLCPGALPQQPPQKIPEEMVIAVPLTSRVQGDGEEVVPLKPVHQLPATGSRRVARSEDRIEELRAEPVEDRGPEHAVPDLGSAGPPAPPAAGTPACGEGPPAARSGRRRGHPRDAGRAPPGAGRPPTPRPAPADCRARPHRPRPSPPWPGARRSPAR